MELSRSEIAVRKFLADLSLFSSLKERELDELVRASRSREVPKGSIVFFENDPADDLFVVRSGAIAILLTSHDGREFILDEMRQGDCFGELALITGRPRSATASALQKSRLIIIPGAHFLDLLDQQMAILRPLLEITAQRVYSSTELEGAMAFLDATARLARVLLMLQKQSTAPGAYITISQNGLAQRTGLTRQTVAKILGRWRRAGWLLTGRGRIMLIDEASLKQVEQQAID
jgi:CRP/FNR family cyclic AMP-dependent transcriptional regulator